MPGDDARVEEQGRPAEPSERPTGVAIIRVWLEPEPDPPPTPSSSVRIRVVHSIDIAGEEYARSAASTIDDACLLVREWLEEVVRRASGPAG